MRADGMCAGGTHQYRIAVGLRGGDDLRADDAGGARAVIDHESLAECRGQLLRHDA